MLVRILLQAETAINDDAFIGNERKFLLFRAVSSAVSSLSVISTLVSQFFCHPRGGFLQDVSYTKCGYDMCEYSYSRCQMQTVGFTIQSKEGIYYLYQNLRGCFFRLV